MTGPSERWQGLVTARLEEMQRLSPGLGSCGGEFWDRRAERFAANVRALDGRGDPFLRRLRAVTDESSTALDVGAGTGRYSLALAPGVKHVSAVDPSAGMLAILERDAVELGVKNVTTIRARWEDADAARSDVVFSSFVLTLVPDARAFLTKLDAAARAHVLLYLGAYSGDAVLDPLWRHFHGAPRVPGPSYLDAIAVLGELGVEPRVRVVELPNRRRFETVAEAVEYYRDGLLLPDTDAARGELEPLLRDWLLGRRGAYRSPLRSIPAAIIDWEPGALGSPA